MRDRKFVATGRLGACVMRGLDGQARIFIGSSSEGRAVAETIASALKAAGMRPLIWPDFFKTRDPPFQELDRRMADADGAILVASAGDRLVSRGKEFDQMRDNVFSNTAYSLAIWAVTAVFY